MKREDLKDGDPVWTRWSRGWIKGVVGFVLDVPGSKIGIVIGKGQKTWKPPDHIEPRDRSLNGDDKPEKWTNK